MDKITKRKLRDILATELKLEQPGFELEQLPGGRISGSVISDSFDGMKDSDRQKQIWDALEKALGEEAIRLVGTILAYTGAEWNVELAEADER